MGTKRTDEQKQVAYNARQDKASEDALAELTAQFTDAAVKLAFAVHEYYETRQTAQWEIED